MTNFLTFDSSGKSTGVGFTPDGTIPAGALACDAAQAAAWQSWGMSNGALIAVTPPAPTLAQQVAALIADGLTITSTSTPALNGLYTVASGVPFGQEDLATEAQFISTFAEFTNGTTTGLEWPLKTGSFVAFTSTAQFLAIAKVCAQFVAACKAVQATNSDLLPSAAVTIP